MLQTGRYIRIGLGVALALIIIGYAASKSINLIEGPEVVIDTPKNGETVHTPLIIISGTAKNIAFLTLNDRQIFVDDAGRIGERLLLYEGYNILTLKARDRFGRETSVAREVVYLPSPNVHSATSSTDTQVND